MFFRNLSLFRFPLTLAKPLADLESVLADCKLKPVSFVKPIGEENEHPGYTSEPRGSDHQPRGSDQMNTGLFIHRPVMTTLITASIIAFGVFGFRLLPVSALVGTSGIAAARAYGWLADIQLPDGSWWNYYLPDGSVEEAKLDTNVCAYIAAGVS